MTCTHASVSPVFLALACHWLQVLQAAGRRNIENQWWQSCGWNRQALHFPGDILAVCCWLKRPTMWCARLWQSPHMSKPTSSWQSWQRQRCPTMGYMPHESQPILQGTAAVLGGGESRAVG